MITIFLQAHSKLPIFLTVQLNSENEIKSSLDGIQIPPMGEKCEITFMGFKACFVVGETVAKNEKLCVYSDSSEKVVLTKNNKVIPWAESSHGEILVI